MIKLELQWQKSTYFHLIGRNQLVSISLCIILSCSSSTPLLFFSCTKSFSTLIFVSSILMLQFFLFFIHPLQSLSTIRLYRWFWVCLTSIERASSLCFCLKYKVFFFQSTTSLYPFTPALYLSLLSFLQYFGSISFIFQIFPVVSYWYSIAPLEF